MLDGFLHHNWTNSSKSHSEQITPLVVTGGDSLHGWMWVSWYDGHSDVKSVCVHAEGVYEADQVIKLSIDHRTIHGDAYIFIGNVALSCMFVCMYLHVWWSFLRNPQRYTHNCPCQLRTAFVGGCPTAPALFIVKQEVEDFTKCHVCSKEAQRITSRSSRTHFILKLPKLPWRKLFFYCTISSWLPV